MLVPLCREQCRGMAGIVMAEGMHACARKACPGPQTGVRQFVEQDQVAGSDQGGDDAGIGEIAGAEDAGVFAVLDLSEPLLQRGIERVIAGDQPGGAGADAIMAHRRDCGLDDDRMLAEIEIIVAAERDQLPPATPGTGAAGALGFAEAAAQVLRLQRPELAGCEFFKRLHAGKMDGKASEGKRRMSENPRKDRCSAASPPEWYR